MSVRAFGVAPNGKGRHNPIYYAAFSRHAVHLILLGYGRLTASEWSEADEVTITGELTQATRAAIESEDAPDWAVHFAVHDDPPVKADDRTGKGRPRVDIILERTERGRHPRYHFEAKRLYREGSDRDYLGDDGLGCFLSGRYAKDENEACMLGYVQSEEETIWAGRISDRLQGSSAMYRICEGGSWQDYDSVLVKLQTLRNIGSYRTRHNRRGPLGAITITHLLLHFLPQ